MPAQSGYLGPRAAAIIMLAALLAHTAQVCAQPAGAAVRPVAADSGVAWSTLTRAQQDALAPLARDWGGIEATQQRKWLELAARLPSMPQDEQQRVQARMAEWAHMTPQERGRARLQFQQARKLSAPQREAKWDEYMALSPQQRRALAEQRSAAAPARKAIAAAPARAATEQGDKSARRAEFQAPKAVAPAVVQPRPGATTTLISNAPAPAKPAKPGKVKVLGERSRVNQSTLLPPPPAGSSALSSR